MPNPRRSLRSSENFPAGWQRGVSVIVLPLLVLAKKLILYQVMYNLIWRSSLEEIKKIAKLHKIMAKIIILHIHVVYAGVWGGRIRCSTHVIGAQYRETYPTNSQ